MLAFLAMNAPADKKPRGEWNPGDSIDSPVTKTVEVDPASISQKDIYKLLIGAIVPRPIAFVSTKGQDGTPNLAPYSFFNGVSSKPPCVMFSCGIAAEGERKDTLRNVQETGEFIINSANEWLVEPLVYTASNYPYGVDEMEKVGLTPAPGVKVNVPRVKEAAVSLECKLYKEVQVGDGTPGSAVMVIGEIIYAHVDERCYKDGKIDFEKYQTVGRLGGFAYAEMGEMFSLPIPKA